MTEQRLLRIFQIVGDKRRGIEPLLPVSKATWWSWVAKGKAPAPVRLGGCTCWREADVLAFMAGVQK
jgi:predicted DNA-binding transcriptional regulator AlpA